MTKCILSTRFRTFEMAIVRVHIVSALVAISLIGFCTKVGASGDAVLQNKCNDTLFLKPYVILRSSKSGPDIAKLETQGVIDLRQAVKAYVCINGPVIIYNNVGTESTSSNARGTLLHVADTKAGETVRFFNGTFKIFSHHCMYINRVTTSDLKKMTALGLQATIDSTTPVYGIKATGIFLIASEEPYEPTNPPVKVMFNQIQYGYEIGDSENLISDSSFVAVGHGPYCLTLKDGSKVVLNTSASSNLTICRWSLAEGEIPNPTYQKAFHNNRNKADYVWEDCPPDIFTASTSNTSGDPLQVGPYAMLDPSKVAPHGSRRGGLPSGGDDWPPREMDGALIPSSKSCSLAPEDPACAQDPEFPFSAPIDPNAPPKNLILQLTTCDTFPTFNPSDSVCTKAGTGGGVSCDKLSVALELDFGTVPPPLMLEAHADLKWKREVLELVATIFSKICLPIRKQTVFRLLRVIDNYIASAHTDKPTVSEYSRQVTKTHTWEILISSLKRCKASNLTSPMEWEWPAKPSGNSAVPIGNDAGRRRKKREIDDGVQELENLLEEVDPGESDRPKAIIERSAPVFELDDKDKERPAIVYGKMPRWRRTPLDDLFIPFIQEYIPPKPKPPLGETIMYYDDFIVHPPPEELRIKDFPDNQIFYYEEMIELEKDLNLAIDAWWKIWASVMGYCQIHERRREVEMYSLLFHNSYEYFFSLIVDKWMDPLDSFEVDMILGELLDKDRSKWLDTCLETSYIVADSLHLRPARPLESQSNLGMMNSFVEVPENWESPDGSGASKYFKKKKA